MKVAIHPQYFDNAQVICVCGNKFTTGSTKDLIRVELCDKCHPFYTGTQKFVDSGSLIKKFEDRKAKGQQYQQTKVKKIEEKRKADEGPKTLREMLMGLK